MNLAWHDCSTATAIELTKAARQEADKKRAAEIAEKKAEGKSNA